MSIIIFADVRLLKLITPDGSNSSGYKLNGKVFIPKSGHPV